MSKAFGKLASSQTTANFSVLGFNSEYLGGAQLLNLSIVSYNYTLDVNETSSMVVGVVLDKGIILES